MRRARNARVIRTHEHFEQQAHFILLLVQNLRDERFEIFLNVRVILVGRDADIRLDAFSIFVESVSVEEN